MYEHINRREQGWRSGVSACLPPMCLRFDSQTRHHMWVEFVFGSPRVRVRIGWITKESMVKWGFND